MKVYLVFSANTPILILSSFENPKDEALRQKLSNMGIKKYLLFEVPLKEARENYDSRFKQISEVVDTGGDIRVLDYNGYSAFLGFNLENMKLVDKVEK